MAVVAWPPPTPPNNRANSTAQLDAHPSDHNRIADALDTLIARVNPSAWTAITLTAPWTAVAGAQAPQYRKVGDMVQLRGNMKGGTNGSTAFTLPAGFRPPAPIDVAIGIYPTSVGAGMGGVGADGTWVYYGANSATEVGINGQFSTT